MVGAAIDPATPVERLCIAQRQMVEIAKALSLNARMILLDEPTSSLSIAEIERLHNVVRGSRRSVMSVSSSSLTTSTRFSPRPTG